jgi:uncharacterized membrane protein YadS
VTHLVPWFLVGFLVLAAVNSIGLVPAAAHPGIQFGALTLITVALTAIGMSAGPRRCAAPVFDRSCSG